MTVDRTRQGRFARKSPQISSDAATTAKLTTETNKTGGPKAKKKGKRAKPLYAKFNRLESRQKAVEQNRRAVYAHLDEITRENIKLAKKGNSAIAKFLFEFAGINQVPALVKATSRTKKNATGGEEKTDDDPTKAVLSFYKKLGIDPPKFKPPKPVELAEGRPSAQSAP
jgi:hypothetical protein